LRQKAIFFMFLTMLAVFTGCNQQSNLSTRNINFSSKESDCVKVMTFNIRTGHAWWLDGWTFNQWGNRRNIVIDTMAENAADIIGTQEGIDFQLEQIQNALPQYSKYSTGRIDGKNKGETCAIFYRKDRFELVDSGTFWFSKKPEKPGSTSWGNLFARICSWVQLEDKTNHTRLYVYNVHLDNWSQHSREKSVRLLADKIANRNTKDPFIVMGDFNMKTNNSAMKYLANSDNYKPSAAMIDTWKSVYPDKPESGTYHQFSGSLNCPKIDHISISKSAHAIDTAIDHREINGRYPSDHFPLVATISIPPRQTASANW
jgi:endonuclease/exonuclease/phosphatase family metal-dependent hydrolase